MIIQSKQVWIDEAFMPQQIEIIDGKISGFYAYEANKPDRDYGELQILPGFIDIHDHGYLNGDANHATTEFLETWSTYLPSEGITAFLPTTSTAFPDDLNHSFEVIGKFIDDGSTGAMAIGIHAEGPMISEKYRGSHNPKLLEKPSIEKFKRWQTLSGNHIRLVTIAPENDENYEVVKYCVENNVEVSIGHTAATYPEAMEAVAAGAKSFTHTFNGMSGVNHRQPGAAVAAMNCPEAYAEIIADGVHVDFALVEVLAKLKGKDHLIAITDSIWAKGCEPGIYPKPEKGVDMIIDENNVVRLKTGSLAGSTNRLDRMVNNLVDKAKIPLATAINAVTINPAKLLNIDHEMGQLKEGHLANFTITNQDFEVSETWIKGEVMYSKG